MRTWIKRAVIEAYCHHWLPMWFVTLVFKVFRLRAL